MSSLLLKRFFSVLLALMMALAFAPTLLQAATPVTRVVTLMQDRNGGAGAGLSLREAIAQSSASDTIEFDSSVSGTLTLTLGYLAITQGITITGPGARKLTISGNNADRVFWVKNAADTVTIQNLTIANGATRQEEDGGGIRKTGEGALTVRNCAITNNTALQGAGIYGGGGPVLIERCTISNNRTIDGGFGGGIDNNSGPFLVVASTISGNYASGIGGGMNSDDAATIVGCTITANTCRESPAGGIEGIGRLTIGNTFIGGNTGGSDDPNIYMFDAVHSLGGNYFVSSHPNAGLINGQNGDHIGTKANPLPSIIEPTLADNGGPTDTHNLIFPWTGVGAGNDALLTTTYFPDGDFTDQRGFPRAGTVDIGAIEVQPRPVVSDQQSVIDDLLGYPPQDPPPSTSIDLNSDLSIDAADVVYTQP